MRITFVVAAADLSGGCRVIAIHARLLRERGHDVHVVAPAPFRPTIRQRARALLRGQALPARVAEGGSHFDAQGVPVRVLARHRPIVEDDVPDADVIVATWWETAEWIRSFSRRKGAKAYFVQGWERHVDGQPGDAVDATLRLPFHKIVISRFLEGVVRDVAGEDDVTLAPNAIDPSQFDAPPRGKQARPTLGFVYSTARAKGLDTARAAIERVREAIPEVRVIAFGAEEASAAHPLPAGTELEHRPAQDRIPRIYASADVWLSASRLEGFGLPALEAMACRTPLVSTRYGGPMGFVRDGENGFLVGVDDAEGLAARAIDVLRMDEPRWSRMSEEAHRTAHALSWRDSSALFEEGLRRALAKS